jgi:hypothetical protein
MCICGLFLPMIRTGAIGMQTFGLSAPMKVVAPHFGLEPEHIVAAAKERRERFICAASWRKPRPSSAMLWRPPRSSQEFRPSQN